MGTIEGGCSVVGTAMVMVEGLGSPVRALCDPGAQTNIITKQAARDWGLKLPTTEVRLTGFTMSKGQACIKTVLRIRLGGGHTSLQITV